MRTLSDANLGFGTGIFSTPVFFLALTLYIPTLLSALYTFSVYNILCCTTPRVYIVQYRDLTPMQICHPHAD